eukprot:36324_1
MSAKSGIHVWTLQKRLKEFVTASNGQKFVSGEFPVGSFSWQVLAYPNGNRFESYGSVMVYLKLLKYPSDLPYGGEVVVNFRIQCLETSSSSTFIETYTRVHDSKGWTSRNLLLSDLTKESITKITFQVDVKILKISNHNQHVTYGIPLKIHKNKYNLRWSVPSEMIHRFEFANNGKWFESGNYSNLFCFKVAPNGYNESNEGTCLLFLQLCALPPNTSKMKCKVKLFHVESSSKWSTKKSFSYESKNAGWTKNKLSHVKLMRYESITFRAEIEILGLYDATGRKCALHSLSDTNYKYKAKAAYDDSVVGTNTNIGSQNVSKQKRAQTAWNPYGGYGSHNYKQYLNDGYKKQQQQKPPMTQNEQKHESSAEEEASDDDESSESEIELDTMEDLEEQVEFLAREYKKLIKILRSLKHKSKANRKQIQSLRKEIQMLKGVQPASIFVGNKGGNTPITPDDGVPVEDLLDLLGHGAGTPITPATPITPQSEDRQLIRNVSTTQDAFNTSEPKSMTRSN